MKSDQSTVQKRVEEILSLRLLGAEFQDIRQHAAQQGWEVSDRQLWRYIAQGDALLAETLETDRGKLVNRHIAQRRALYARAMAVSDYRTALAVLRDEAELLSLYPSKSINVSGKDGGPVTLHIVEQIVGRPAAIGTGAVIEEVVTSEHRSTESAHGSIASRANGLPA